MMERRRGGRAEWHHLRGGAVWPGCGIRCRRHADLQHRRQPGPHGGGHCSGCARTGTATTGRTMLSLRWAPVGYNGIRLARTGQTTSASSYGQAQVSMASPTGWAIGKRASGTTSPPPGRKGRRPLRGRRAGRSRGRARARSALEPLYVGSGAWDGRVADGVLDELRISDVPRMGNSLACGRVLVARQRQPSRAGVRQPGAFSVRVRHLAAGMVSSMTHRGWRWTPAAG